jgi:tetratricopeptide (TPR) repeat protein
MPPLLLAAEFSPNDPVYLEKVAELLELTDNVDQAARISLDIAEQYAKNRNINKAIEHWSKVTHLVPDHLLAHSRLALVYEKLGRKQQAIVEYLAIASLLQHSGEVQKALQTVNHILQIDPDSPEAKQALLMLKAGRPLPKPRRVGRTVDTSTISGVSQPVKPVEKDQVSPDPIQETRQLALSTLAGLLFEAPGEDEGDTSKRDLHSIFSGSGIFSSQQADQTKITLHLSQAIDMQSHGMDRQALEELQRAIDAGLKDVAAFFNLGFLLVQEGRLESAIRNLQTSVRNAKYALGSRLLLGQTLWKMKRIDEAVIEYLEALKIADIEVNTPKNTEALTQQYESVVEAQSHLIDTEAKEHLCENIANLLMRPNWRSNVQMARQQLPEEADDAPPVPIAEVMVAGSSREIVESMVKARQLARSGKHRAAMEEAYHALQYAPTYLPLHIFMGDVLVQENQLEEAVSKYSVVARSYNMRGETMRAISLYKRIITLDPMDLQVRTQLIDSLSAHGQIEPTIHEYLKLADIYYSLADLAKARETYEQALHYCQQVNAEQQWKIDLMHRLADIEMQNLDWRQALRVYDQIRLVDPLNHKARTMLVDLNYRLNQPGRAITELDNYLSILLKAGQGKEALELVVNSVADNPDQIPLRRRLAELYRQQGRTEEAIEQLDEGEKD